jgi:cardiolipin synthase (CMP-forming)
VTVANILTIIRIILIPFFLLAMIYGHYVFGVIVFVTAGVTDGLDGFVARFYHQKTSIGAILDPMADKLMLTTVYVVLALPNIGLPYSIPMWVPVLTISRDVIIVLFALLLNLFLDVSRFPPSWAGKCTTFFQIVYAAAALIKNAFGFPGMVAGALMWAVAVFTVFSGLHYLWRIRTMTQGVQ